MRLSTIIVASMACLYAIPENPADRIQMVNLIEIRNPEVTSFDSHLSLARSPETISVEKANNLLSFKLPELDLSKPSHLEKALDAIIGNIPAPDSKDPLSAHKTKLMNMIVLLAAIHQQVIPDFDFSRMPSMSLPRPSAPDAPENLEATAYSRLYNDQFDLQRIQHLTVTFMTRYLEHYLSDEDRVLLVGNVKAWSSSNGLLIPKDIWQSFSGK